MAGARSGDVTVSAHSLPAEAGVVRQIAVPREARALSTLSRVDYADTFAVEIGGVDHAERFARAMLDGAPVGLRAGLWSTWWALGLKLGSPRSRRLVLGWKVRRSTPDFALLGADSHIGMPAELLFKRERGTLLFATFVEHENAVARAVWAAVDLVHRPVVRHVLEDAARRIGGRTDAG
jgi:hypothetical protein